MKIKVIKLGTPTKDKGTKLNGMVTHWLCDTGKRIEYLFQPKGTSPEDGQPVDKLVLEPERLQVSDADYEEVDIPFEVLGTEVEDMASGFKGTAVAFIRHMSGCFHVSIQPHGLLRRSNSPVKRHDFDLRQCKGKMIPKQTEEEVVESKKKNPSPSGDKFMDYIPETRSGF